MPDAKTNPKVAFGAFDAIEHHSGRNDKIALLTNSSFNRVMTDLLYQAYNPFIKFGIKDWGEVEFPDQPIETDQSGNRHEVFMSILKNLSEGNLRGSAATSVLRSFFSRVSPEEYRWYSKTIKKDLGIGISISSINKAITGLIPVFKCMRAKDFDEVKRKPKKVYTQRKLDGFRLITMVHKSGDVELYSRNGKRLIGFTAIEEEMSALPRGYVYDSELTGKTDDFKDMQSVAFKKQASGKEGIVNIFDVLPIDEFLAGKSKKKLKERVDLVHGIQDIIDETQMSVVKIVEFSREFDLATEQHLVMELYEQYVTEGCEGAVIKCVESYYECKKSSLWLKLKPTKTDEFVVIGYKAGDKDGKRAETLGSLTVKFEDNEVEIGGGYSEEQLDLFWTLRDKLIGAVIEVEFDKYSENKEGKRSLRFPRFKRFRLDKMDFDPFEEVN